MIWLLWPLHVDQRTYSRGWEDQARSPASGSSCQGPQLWRREQSVPSIFSSILDFECCRTQIRWLVKWYRCQSLGQLPPGNIQQKGILRIDHLPHLHPRYWVSECIPIAKWSAVRCFVRCIPLLSYLSSFGNAPPLLLKSKLRYPGLQLFHQHREQLPL